MPQKNKEEEEEKLSNETDVEVEKEEKEEKKKIKKNKITRRRITVNFWRTSLHGEKIGLRQKDQQRAKSRQFSKDMELYGEVRFGNKKAGNIGFRVNEWKETELSKGKLPRLVIRYFNENGRWVGSIEEDTIRGLMLSIAYREEIPVFKIFMQANSNIFTLEKIEKTTGSDEVIVPLILEKKGKAIDFFIFDRRRFTMGDDWKVFRPNEKDITIADLDSKKLDIGGKVNINIYDPVLAENKIFVNTLILFTSLIKFWGDVKNSLKDAYKKFRDNEFVFKPSRYEIELLENPRGSRI